MAKTPTNAPSANKPAGDAPKAPENDANAKPASEGMDPNTGEVLDTTNTTGTNVATQAPGPSANALNDALARLKHLPGKFVVVKQVTLPQLKIVTGVVYLVQFTSPFYLGKEVPVAEGKKKMEVPHLANVMNLDTGVECTIVAGDVMRKEIEDKYPKEAYNGKAFAIQMQRVEGKRYNQYMIIEIAQQPAA